MMPNEITGANAWERQRFAGRSRVGLSLLAAWLSSSVRRLHTMRVLRTVLGAVGFGGLLIWPALCMFVWRFPKFQIGEPQGPGLSAFEVTLYVITPLLAFAYYIFASVATPRRIIAVVGVALHLLLVAVILAAMRYPDGVLIAALALGGVLSFLYESQSFSRRVA
jgi:hypothetical protein